MPPHQQPLISAVLNGSTEGLAPLRCMSISAFVSHGYAWTAEGWLPQQQCHQGASRSCLLLGCHYLKSRAVSTLDFAHQVMSEAEQRRLRRLVEHRLQSPLLQSSGTGKRSANSVRLRSCRRMACPGRLQHRRTHPWQPSSAKRQMSLLLHLLLRYFQRLTLRRLLK